MFKKFFTRDDASGLSQGRMQFYVTEKIGPKQSLTPEGFLLCEEVPLARTGEMIYGPNEVPVQAGADGLVRIVRDESEVFRPEYLASLSGKPVVNDHPPEDVNPVNWKNYSIGVTVNPRRGTGMMADLVVGDLLVCDQEAIADVRSGKREVSVGYDADYDELGPGRGRQYNLVANHVALVEAGRCGPRCSIGDRKTTTHHSTGDCSMAKTKDKRSLLQVLKDALKTKDQKTIDEAMAQTEEALADDAAEGTEIHVHGGMRDEEAHARLDSLTGMVQQIHDKLGIGSATDEESEEEKAAKKEKEEKASKDAEANKEIEGELKEEAPAGAADAAVKARDSQYLGDSFQEAVALAEVLVPGIRVPTFDKAMDPKKTFDAICLLRKTALDLAYSQPEGRAIVDQVNGGKPLDITNMHCRDVRSLFRAVGVVKKQANNNTTHTTVDVGAGGGLGVKGKIRSPADLNKRLAEMYPSA